MQRKALTALALAGLLVLAGCSGSVDTGTPDSHGRHTDHGRRDAERRDE